MVIAYVFPPAAGVGGQRIANFCHYLPEHGIEPVVLTVREEYYDQCDSSLVLPGDLRVERTAQGATLLSLYGAMKAGVSRPASEGVTAARVAPRRAEAGAPRASLRQQVVLGLQTPDPFRGWRRQAVRSGRGLLRQGGFHAIFSSGPPWTAHVVARNLKRRYHLPWLADFRDPWAGLAQAGLPGWKRALDGRIESACVKDADLIICNTDALRADFAARYPQLPALRLATITNGFVAPVPAPAALAPGPKRVALHLGSLYQQRRIDSFCQAVERLFAGGAVDPVKVEFLFVGDAGADFLNVAARHAPRALAQGLLRFRPAVPRAETGALLHGASLLLLFQGSYRLQLPAKFFEYLQTGKPMFAVAEPGALTQMLDETQTGLWANPSDPAGIAETLLRSFALPCHPAEEAERAWAERFHYRVLTAELARRTQELLEGGPAQRVPAPRSSSSAAG